MDLDEFEEKMDVDEVVEKMDVDEVVKKMDVDVDIMDEVNTTYNLITRSTVCMVYITVTQRFSQTLFPLHV